MSKSNKIFFREAARRTKDGLRDMGQIEMRARDPYEILGIKKKPSNLPAPPANPKSGEKT